MSHKKMNSIIYVCNKKDGFIGIYKIKDTDSESENSIYDEKKDSYINNQNNNIQGNLLYLLTKNLKNNILYFNILKISRNNAYFFVVLDTFEQGNLLEKNFEKLLENDKIYKEMLKIYNDYQYKKKTKKFITIIDSFFSIYTVWDVIKIIILIISLIISLIILRAKMNNNIKIIVILNIILLIIPYVKSIINAFEKFNIFKTCRNTSIFIEGISKMEIIKDATENLTSKYKNFESMHFNGDEAFIYSDKENEIFDEISEKLKVNFTKNKYHMSDDTRKALFCIISDKINNNKSIFNGKLLGINSDLNFSELNEVKLKQIRYFEYVSADECIFKNVYLPQDNHQIIEGHKMTMNHINKSLFNIENSHLTNLIGINLIVELEFNSKSYYIINRQNLANDVNQLKFVPSASGSLDKKDYKKLKKLKLDKFKDVLKIGMLRELMEESYINIYDYKNYNNNLNLTFESFKLLGFARLVSKAGKPDFFGRITFKISDEKQIEKILNNYNEYQNNKIKKVETIAMKIVSKKELFENEENYSPQLQYIIHLLKKN